ncbi:ABC transporter substrate-binding protein [Saccharobesus litoralis]|uniref:ABC transporter substrate-binding protein n=1 Tax=Saccharobesus litoralis TaxID=2172099 RepID=UPI00131F22AE|nr:ABC transporter substrate-binding protein [Saccharobesus litoralis]
MLSHFNVLATDKLYVGIGIGPKVQAIHVPIYQDFEKETGIKIIRVRIADMKDLDDRKNWQTKDGQPIDIINAHASRRLLAYYQRGDLKRLNELWQANNLDKYFAHLSDTITFDSHKLLLPLTINGWHIYYLNSANFQQWHVPQTLEELATTCKQLSAKNIIPFYIAAKTPWNIAAWFEYLTLRLHGLTFFQQLTNGEISYQSDKVRQVLLAWQQLIHANCFSEAYGEQSWKDVMHLFYRNEIAFVFGNNSIITSTSTTNKFDNLNFFNFPKGANIPRYESVPVQGFAVNKNSEKHHAIKRFLLFMSQAHVQNRLSSNTGRFAANRLSSVPPAPLIQKLANALSTAAGHSQFIDRMLPPDFEKHSRPLFVQFIRSGEIKPFAENMERLRRKYFK